MKDWIISVITVVLITSIICLILPQGKMGKYVKNIFSILTMLVIIKPIISLKEKDFNFEQAISANNIVLQHDYIEYINNKRIDEYKENCLKIIENKGVKNSMVSIDYLIEENENIKITYVQINLQNSVIISDKQHIDIKEEMITDIATYLNVKKSVVTIYDWIK